MAHVLSSFNMCNAVAAQFVCPVCGGEGEEAGLSELKIVQCPRISGRHLDSQGMGRRLAGLWVLVFGRLHVDSH